MDTRRKKLIGIMKFIGIKSISDIKESQNPEEDDKSFELRMRIQKIMFFVVNSKADPDLNYSYPIYLRGPYSTELYKDYFSISEKEYNDSKNINEEDRLSLLHILDLLQALKEKETIWLEIASTLKMLKDANWKDKEAIDRVIEMKRNILDQNNKDPSYVKRVWQEMNELKL